jgi:pyruvate ferredoxin oxidoreductase delta subunit
MITLKETLGNRFGPQKTKNQSALLRGYEEMVKCEATRVSAHTREEDVITTRAHKNRVIVKALHPWTDLEIGCDIVQPGNTGEFVTGTWRTVGKPEMTFGKCTKCGICWIICPDRAYTPTKEGFYTWDGRFCKGCGICAEECPKGAIEMKGE